MQPLTPCAFLGAAQALQGFGETSADERGRFVEAILREAGQPQHAPWDLAFIQHAGWWSQRGSGGNRSSWPFPRDASHQDLAVLAHERRITRATPEDGDIALYWSSDVQAFTWSAIVSHRGHSQVNRNGIRRFRCVTIEGNLTEQGVRGGGYIRELVRTISPARGDLFIRWAALDPQRAMSNPDTVTTREAGRVVLLESGPELELPRMGASYRATPSSQLVVTK